MDADLDFDDKKKYEEFYSLIGAKIRFKCDGYIQEGEIKAVMPTGKRVTMNNVYFILPDKKIFSGTLKYRFDDLANYEIIATASELNPYPRFEYLENILKGNNAGKKYSLNDLFYDGYLSESEEEEENNKNMKEDEFVFEIPSHLEKIVPHDFVTIDCFDLQWKQAIKHIGLQKIIGVSFHGTKVTRLGKLSWMCISTVWCVFLFDIEKLGVDAFNNGLKSILENQKIKKVIHDCRFPSDSLAHKFDTKLANVFDTLVADFVVSMQYYNDKYKYEYVQCLNSCLRIYLKVPPEFSYARDRYKQNNQNDIYSKRPLNNALRSILIKDTIYLLQLHDVLAKKLLGPLHRNADRYLKVIAGASKQELDTLKNEISSPNCIPSCVLMYGIQTVKFNKLERKEPVSLKCKFLDPTTGKEIDFKKQTVNEIEPSHLASSVDKTQNYDTEKSCNTVKDRQHMLPVLKDKKSCTTESLHFNNKSVIVDKMVAMSSLRHMDEVYHKLANSNYFHSRNTESAINIKPSKNYESKFTMRMPLECSAFSNSDCCETDTVGNTDFPNTSTSSSLMISNTSDNLPDYSDTWAKLRAACSDEYNVLQNTEKPSNIKFVPAGMSLTKDKKSSISLLSNKKSVIVDKPISQHMDDVDHNLENMKYFHSKNTESVINIKPSKNYKSKFTVRKPLEYVALSNSDSNETDTVGNVQFSNPSTSSSVMVSNTADNLSDYSDTLTSLQAAFSDECNVSQKAEMPSNIKFVQTDLSVLKDKKKCSTESVQLNKKSVIIGKMIATPSSQHMEVYHKLANSKYFHSKNAEIAINIKSSKNFESKFTMRKPFECLTLSNSDSCETDAVGNTNFPNPSTSSSVVVSNTSDNLSDYSDTWAKLREACSNECNISQNSKKPSNIKFVPAGMSC